MSTPSEVNSAIATLTNSKQAQIDALTASGVASDAETAAMEAKTAAIAALKAANDKLAADKTAAIEAINTAFGP